MVYVALLEAVALVAVTLVFAGLVRSMVRQQARERAGLLDRIMHLAGRTWEPPPAEPPFEITPEELAEIDPSLLPDWG